MQVGIMMGNLVFRTAQGAAAIGQACERHGFESIWTVEHIVVPDDYRSPYPYAEDGKMPGGPATPIPEPLTWLTFVAAHTSGLRLGTGITVLPVRHPLILAKETATLDQLSDGRLILGVGTGWMAEEFDALGVPFEGRGGRTDEYIAALRELWTGEAATFRGEHVRFEGVHSQPPPVAGRVPIVVGGHSDRAARRAGELGDGFFPGTTDPATLARSIEVMRRAAEGAGRDPGEIEVTVIGEPTLESLDHRASLGAHRVLVPPPTRRLDVLDERMAQLAERLQIAAS